MNGSAPWLLQKLSQYHEIVRVKFANHDLSESFFQKLKKNYYKQRYVVLEYLRTRETPCRCDQYGFSSLIVLGSALF